MTSLSMSPDFYQGPLKNLFDDGTTLIDVRAPVEYLEGAFFNSVNLPILSNEQRHLIGICYKEKGQEAAITLGHQLVNGADREEKIRSWLKLIKDSRQKTYLYCFRGGLRSQISQQWIKDEGASIEIIRGGYKCLRNFLLTNLEKETNENSFLVVSGNTGSGKTNLIKKMSDSGFKALDLENMANHRGSVFGRNSTPQPSQIDFENKISISFFKQMEKRGSKILLEDEGIKIGHLRVPLILNTKQNCSPIFVYERSMEDRVALILKDYCIESWKNFEGHIDSYQLFFEFFKASFDQIQKRLGGALYQECLKILSEAIDQQENSGSFARHQDWIKKILTQYYDPHYEAGLNRKKEFIIARGDESVLREILTKG